LEERVVRQRPFFLEVLHVTPLRQRYIEDLRLKNFSPGTIRQYVLAVAAFARFHGCSPEKLSREDIRAYLVHLLERGLTRGPSADRSRWVSCRRAGRRDFFLPVRVLSRVFRGKFIALFKQAFGSGQLQFAGSLSALRSANAFGRLLSESVRREWVVYAKRPFGGPQQVLKYLARYTHRVAISNQRLIALRDGRVTFSYQDYADGRKIKAMTLESVEFIRRFLLHVLPAGFVRIRYYGFLANRDRQQHLAECRRLLGVNAQEPLAPEPPWSRKRRNCHRPRLGSVRSANTASSPSYSYSHRIRHFLRAVPTCSCIVPCRAGRSIPRSGTSGDAALTLDIRFSVPRRGRAQAHHRRCHIPPGWNHPHAPALSLSVAFSAARVKPGRRPTSAPHSTPIPRFSSSHVYPTCLSRQSLNPRPLRGTSDKLLIDC
jgi:hypothetical protein